MEDKNNPPTFEEGLGELESIVESLETRNLDLDESIKAFEKGLRLSKALSEKLELAEAKVESLSKGGDGRLKATPIPPGSKEIDP